MSRVIKKPVSQAWKDAHDQRNALYNNPAWYHHHWTVRDRINSEWNRLTKIMRQEVIKQESRAHDRKYKWTKRWF